MTGSVAARVSFAESSALLRELAAVEVSVKQVERAAETLGVEIAEDERQCVERLGEIAPTMYLGMDGTGVLTVPQKLTSTYSPVVSAAEVAGRAGKQPDGTAKTREVKLVTVWTAESRDEDNKPVRDAGSITCSAAIESAAVSDTSLTRSNFAQRVLREATRRGVTEAPRCAVLGDGSAWIWNTTGELFPQAIHILDRFHAKQHLSDVGKIIHSANSEERRQWIQQRYDELDEGRIEPLLQALDQRAPEYDEARKCAEYFRHNRERIRYPEFHAQGLCTATGVVEAGCKVAIGARLKRSGMHWTESGANAIIALRGSKLSGRYEDFRERRSGSQRLAA